MVAVLGLLSGVIFVMGDSIFGEEVAVPNIVGMDYSQADEALKESRSCFDS